MGAPTATVEEINQLRNTSAWAFRLPIPPLFRSSAYDAATTEPKFSTYQALNYKNLASFYTSPLLHTVTLTNLTPGATYGYQVDGDNRTFSFTMPPDTAVYPMTIGLTADLGQTVVSRKTVQALKERLESAEPHAGLVLVAGDLSYADGWPWRWDTWGNMMEPLAAQIPLMSAPGNHEVMREQYMPYNARYPMPYASSGSPTNLWWSRAAGPVHVISLCTYADSSIGSLQYKWLERDLSRVDRTVTPWLLVMMHTPWYNSNKDHQGESEPMRVAMEPLVFAYGVDIVLNGHVHSYERSIPVYAGCPNECGPTYLNLGDGGNYEGSPTFNGNPWLDPQPEWSAFRASTFGAASLVFHNDTHAYYSWTRSACSNDGPSSEYHIDLQEADCVTDNDKSAQAAIPSDATWIVRPTRRNTPSSTCGGEDGDAAPPPPCTFPPQAPSPVGFPPPPPTSPAPSAPDCDSTCIAVVVGVASGAFGVLIGFAAGALVMASMRKPKQTGTKQSVVAVKGDVTSAPGASNVADRA